MGRRIERCPCGQPPSFVAAMVAQSVVQSQFVCQRGKRIPGGGYLSGGCGKQGPEVEDAYSDPDAAAYSWNMMIRNEWKEHVHD